MKTILLAVVLGGVLGLMDGLSAWFTPDARPQLGEIVMGSAMKDVLGGFLIGVFAVFVRSKPAVIIWGLVVGLGLAFAVAAMQEPNKYYLQIMLPGGLVGILVGYATAHYGRHAVARTASN